jgi:3-oxoacyl-[acyl-carrier-protein] synthase-3
MLEEAWNAGRFSEGDRILLVVPESGRFSFAFAHLTCVSADTSQTTIEVAAPAAGKPVAKAGPAPRDTQRLVLDLAQVWEDFERWLRRTPIVHRIESGTASIEDYKRLLVHLRQQVIEGGRWISRAASNFSLELFDFRSAAIKHAADEHKDYRLLERDYVAVGGDLAEIQSGRKNAGSEALSAFIFQQASLPDPVDLLGAMFIIEGLGNRLALGWATRLQEQLSLRDDQVSFIRYHGEADAEHIGELNHLLALVTAEHHERVVRTAQVVARLYALQLEEVN